MEPQISSNETQAPSSQRPSERDQRERFRAGRIAGKIEGFRAGELQGKRGALLRIVERAGIPLTDGDRARVHACADAARLDQWLGNVLGAKTASDVLA
jgi:hypothetical protein